MPKARVFDTIPFSQSSEAGQNSEPSLAVNPLDPTQIFAAAFSFFSGSAVITPYFKSSTGGTSWFDDGSLTTQDKSLAWKQDGSAALTTTLLDHVINTYSETAAGSNFGAPIHAFDPGYAIDQPWVRTGPSNHVYVTYNADGLSDGKTASVLVSTDGGSHYTSFTLDRVGATAPDPFDEDAPSVRSAVNGNTVYAVFTRWNTVVESNSDGTRLGAQVVIVRSDNGGTDGFTAFGPGDGVQVATTTSADAPATAFTQTDLTLGQERIGGDLAIAVDPHNAMHVVVAYGNSPDSKQLQLVVTESTDGGMSWTQKFATPTSTGGSGPRCRHCRYSRTAPSGCSIPATITRPTSSRSTC